MTAPAERLESARRDATALAAVLGQACAEAEAGAAVDLSGLDDRIAALCRSAEGLPRGPGRNRLLKDIRSLIASLEKLGAALAAQHDTLTAAAEGRSDPHSARQRAAAAYGRPPGPDTPPGDKT